MTTRMRNRKRPEPGQKSTPMALGPTIGLMAVCLLGIVCMFLWTTRHASAPMAAQPARSAPAYTSEAHLFGDGQPERRHCRRAGPGEARAQAL